MHDPLFNKGTAFRGFERDRLGLRGLVPPRRLTMDTQLDKVLSNFRALRDPLQKNVYLCELMDRNETLFYRLVIENIEEMAPIIYTPTVGKVCQKFGTVFRRTRGMYFCQEDRGMMGAMVYNWPRDDVQVVVVTDGSRILGLGDLGVNGMGIPIGKLALYCAAGGLQPDKVLPVMLDLGTNNEELLRDPHYLGLPHRRLEGDDYYSLVDEFMSAVRYRWPEAVIQFEDFSSDKAMTILNTYKDEFCCFNDDIQGTGATTLAGILSALRVQGKGPQDLVHQKVVVAGAGSAGLGVAEALRKGMVQQGMSEEDAQRTFFVCDQHGLLSKSRGAALTADQHVFARDDLPDGLSLEATVKEASPTILLGVSGCGGLFTESLVAQMASVNERPIIFPLSNPTSAAECTAEQAYDWSGGSAIFASGSPFDGFLRNGNEYQPSQCNNMFIFPGVGFAAVVCGAKVITDSMLFAAAEALAGCLPPSASKRGQVFPAINNIRDVSATVAAAVIRDAVKNGIATTEIDLENVEENVRSKMYDPTYSQVAATRSEHLARSPKFGIGIHDADQPPPVLEFRR